MTQPEMVNIRELLGNEQLLFKKDGRTSTGSQSALDGKYVGLYFSAHWCPPCRAFTPQLRKVYEKLTHAGKPFEIVFVSSDRSPEQFEEYYSEMPWSALPFSSAQKSVLSSHFGIKGIPALVLIAPDGTVVSRNAKAAVINNPNGFPWEGAEGAASADASSARLRSFLIYGFLLAWLLIRMFWK